MDSFELNKVLGAVLGTCLFVLALNIAAGAMLSAPKPAKPTTLRAGASCGRRGCSPGGGGADREAVGERHAERGETAAKKRQACHTFNKGS